MSQFGTFGQGQSQRPLRSYHATGPGGEFYGKYRSRTPSGAAKKACTRYGSKGGESQMIHLRRAGDGKEFQFVGQNVQAAPNPYGFRTTPMVRRATM